MFRRKNETALRRRRVYRGTAVDFWADTIRTPQGGTSLREYLGHPGAVAVVPIKKEGVDPALLFVEQYRYPVKSWTLEIPAGKLDSGERPQICAQRELEEETGWRAGHMRKLLRFWPTPAFANEVIHIYVARQLVAGTFRPDDDEWIRPKVLRLSQALRLIKNGRLQDSKTIIGLLAYQHWGSLATQP